MRIHAALFIRREDMVNALGKRPFDTSDDMDKYLDEEVGVLPHLMIVTPHLQRPTSFRLNENLGKSALPRPLNLYLTPLSHLRGSHEITTRQTRREARYYQIDNNLGDRHLNGFSPLLRTLHILFHLLQQISATTLLLVNAQCIT